MARRGTFGRTPRAVASLTNTLVSIARQQEQQADQNIVDAWKNGGTYEGQKVTDEMVLAHFKKRLGDVSKDDPQYDAFSNAVQQFEYTIAQSKQDLLFAQKKISATQYAQFYLKWAQKIPKDSEFYRTLQKDAANLLHQNAASGAGAAAAAKEKAYQTNVQHILDTQVAGGQFLLEALTYGGRTNLALTGNQQFTDQTASDPSAFIGMFKKWATAGNNVIYQDGTGHNWTGNEFLAKMKTFDPHFTMASLTPNYVKTMFQKSRDGNGKVVALAKSTGHASDVNSFTGSQNAFNLDANTIGAASLMPTYNDARKARDDVMKNPASTPMQIATAQATYTTFLTGLLNSPEAKADPTIKQKIEDEIALKPNSETLAQDFNGTNTSTGDTVDPAARGNGDNFLVGQDLTYFNEHSAAVAAGTEAWTTGTYTINSSGVRTFLPGQGGTQVGPVDAMSIGALYSGGAATGGGAGVSPVMVPNGDGKGVTPVYTENTPIYAYATAPDGKKVDTGDAPLGFISNVPDGTGSKIMYGVNVTNPDGKGTHIEWSDRSFLAAGLTPQVVGGRTVVDISQGIKWDNATKQPVAGQAGVTITPGAGWDGSTTISVDGSAFGVDGAVRAANGYGQTGSASKTAAFAMSVTDPAYKYSITGSDAAIKQIVAETETAYGGSWIMDDKLGNGGYWAGGDQTSINNTFNKMITLQGLDKNSLSKQGINPPPPDYTVYHGQDAPNAWLDNQKKIAGQDLGTPNPNDLVGYAYRVQQQGMAQAVVDLSNKPAATSTGTTTDNSIYLDKNGKRTTGSSPYQIKIPTVTVTTPNTVTTPGVVAPVPNSVSQSISGTVPGSSSGVGGGGGGTVGGGGNVPPNPYNGKPKPL